MTAVVRPLSAVMSVAENIEHAVVRGKRFAHEPDLLLPDIIYNTGRYRITAIWQQRWEGVGDTLSDPRDHNRKIQQ